MHVGSPYDWEPWLCGHGETVLVQQACPSQTISNKWTAWGQDQKAIWQWKQGHAMSGGMLGHIQWCCFASSANSHLHNGDFLSSHLQPLCTLKMFSRGLEEPLEQILRVRRKKRGRRISVACMELSTHICLNMSWKNTNCAESGSLALLTGEQAHIWSGTSVRCLCEPSFIVEAWKRTPRRGCYELHYLSPCKHMLYLCFLLAKWG